MSPANTRPIPTDTFLSRDLEEEYIFYDRQGDQVHILNGTAREIFLLCDGARTAEEIALELVRRYEVGEEQALADVTETLHRLLELGLLRT